MRFRRFIIFAISSVVIITFLYILQQYWREYGMFKDSLTANGAWKTFRTKPTLYIAVVACGQRFQETTVMIKSALLFNYPRDRLHFLIFVEDQEISERFREKLDDWRQLSTDFDYSLLSLKFPANNEAEWHNLFKPCAAQRLFLPSLLDKIDALLYVDTDILFLSPVADIWQYFKQFNSTQLAALTPEHEEENVGWYNRFARHPFYGNLGVNSGVMLMNLTRMREFRWEEKVLPIHKEYKLRITWGDQDIINILFYFHPERLFIMPCEYNFRPDHCLSVCNTSSVQGIRIIHGNRGYFHSNKQPLFKEIYESVERYQLDTDAYENFLQPLEAAVGERAVHETTCGRVAKDALYTARKIFMNDYQWWQMF